MYMRFRGGGVGHRYARPSEHLLGETDELIVEDKDDVLLPEANLAGAGSDSEAHTDSEGDVPEGSEEDDDDDDDGDEGYDSNEADQGLGAEDGDGEGQDDPHEDEQYADM
ncbi:hypothetical protein FIBSPDRAFT_892299 [Athelia psychrophila]|uniref:Uncharacterized protein n=1 Tax=Athelia psychrophila TaxID=1759441 RepID=A0A166IK01_9AGAM|nr:hypothetical protein FIBSPDRAFT_892299 [Fibularhizoctonia sp. CBS 109695]